MQIASKGHNPHTQSHCTLHLASLLPTPMLFLNKMFPFLLLSNSSFQGHKHLEILVSAPRLWYLPITRIPITKHASLWPHSPLPKPLLHTSLAVFSFVISTFPTWSSTSGPFLYFWECWERSVILLCTLVEVYHLRPRLVTWPEFMRDY